MKLPPIVERERNTPRIRPEFIRLPKDGETCPHSGFSRTGLYRLTVPCKANGHNPAVPAKCLRQRGNSRGIWLVPYDALMTYLHALPTPGMAPAGGDSP